MIGINGTLINLDDFSTVIDQERRGKLEIAMAIKEQTIKSVVNRGYVDRSAKDWESKFIFADDGAGCRFVGRTLKIYGKQLQPTPS